MDVDKAFLRGVRRIKFVSECGKEGEGTEAHTCACISSAIASRPVQLVSGFSSEFAFSHGRQRALRTSPISSEYENLLSRRLRRRFICLARTRRLETVFA